MEGLFKIVFCLTFLFIINNKLFAQWEQHDPAKESNNVHVLKTDADLVEEMTDEDKANEVIVFTKSTGEVFIPQKARKEKRFVSVDEKEKNFYEKEPVK